MTNEFVNLRFDMAIKMVENIYSDLCHESTADVSRELTYELCHLLFQMRDFASKLKEQGKVLPGALDEKIEAAENKAGKMQLGDLSEQHKNNSESVRKVMDFIME